MTTEIPVEHTSTYPTRYAAFDRNGVLFVHNAPKQSGGHELAVYDSPRLHGTVTVCAPAYFGASHSLLVEVVKGGFGNWKAVYSERMPYYYERAQRTLIAELTKLVDA